MALASFPFSAPLSPRGSSRQPHGQLEHGSGAEERGDTERERGKRRKEKREKMNSNYPLRGPSSPLPPHFLSLSLSLSLSHIQSQEEKRDALRRELEAVRAAKAAARRQ